MSWFQNLLFEVIHNPSEAYFGQKSKEHVKTIKKYCIHLKTKNLNQNVYENVNENVYEKC